MIANRLSSTLASLLMLALASGALAVVKPNEGDDVASPAPKNDEFSRLAKLKMEELDRTFGKGYFIYFCDDGIMPRPYLVAAEYKKSFDPETLEREYAEIFGYLYQNFFDQYGQLLEADSINEPVVALVWESKESYKKLYDAEKAELESAKLEKRAPKLEGREIHQLADPEFMGGYFWPYTEYLYQWNQPDLWHVMFHEGTHQLVHHATKKWNPPQSRSTPWFQEGIADYLGGHTKKKSYSEEKKSFVTEFKLGQFIQERYTVLMNALQGGTHLPLKELCYMDFGTFKGFQNAQDARPATDTDSGNLAAGKNQRITGLVYAQGWALVKFLNQFQNGKYRGNFNEYFKKECRGLGGGATFAEIFALESDQDWEDLEAEWHEWIYGDLRSELPRK